MMVMSRLDYCNSILFGISNKLLLDKLQRVQNCVTKLVLTSNMEHQSSPESLKTLHWLPIKYWIQYKILLLVFKSTEGFAPPYLHDLLRPHKKITTFIKYTFPDSSKVQAENIWRSCFFCLWTKALE